MSAEEGPEFYTRVPLIPAQAIDEPQSILCLAAWGKYLFPSSPLQYFKTDPIGQIFRLLQEAIVMVVFFFFQKKKQKALFRFPEELRSDRFTSMMYWFLDLKAVKEEGWSSWWFSSFPEKEAKSVGSFAEESGQSFFDQRSFGSGSNDCSAY
ncbi:hypothetical protein TRICI_003056 [Trichomonascus ciferrii]|uniref:Uncharacterized protein n=1 Tax=Trichomonascus ciferrii TaxID=44093 RepID=A0A642V469_9ASCO|nr:hypothetical protein TRICI_003056 [Trichomonascus ciferrii]